AERREDAARVQPAHPELPEQVVPVDVPGLELGGCGVAAVGDADGAAHPEAALGEVEAVAHRPAHAVVLLPTDEGGVDAAGQDEVLDESAHLVVREGGDHGGAQPESTPQPARDVVLPAALPGAEAARGADAPLPGVEAEHDLAEGDGVEAALLGGADGQGAHADSPAARATAWAVSWVIVAKSSAATASRGTIQEPPTASTAGRSRYS